MWLDYWIERLEDPFEMFALDAVLRSIGRVADDALTSRAERAGPWGVSPKYYSVQDEHDIEVVEHVIGSGFVLAQTSITQAVTMVKRMYDDAGRPAWIPKDKAVVLKTAAPIHTRTGFSKIAIINTVADYYKHRSEWKDDEWVESTKNKTVASSMRLGLGLKGYHQMEHALRELQIYNYDMSPLVRLIGDWREGLAEHLRGEGKKHGIDLRPRYPEVLDSQDEAPATRPTMLDGDDVPFP